MAAALFSEMSHPHGDPNTGPSPARFTCTLNVRDPACASDTEGIKCKC